MQKTKPPALKIATTCDDLVVSVEGVEYHPHAGEKIVLEGQRASWQFMRALTLLDSDPSAADTIIAVLAAVVKSWTWTDNEGNDMPQPCVEVLNTLALEEVLWLAQLYIAGPKATAKKD